MKRIFAACTGLAACVAVVGYASADSICVGRQRFTVWTNNYITNTFACEQCFGDAVGPNCPSTGADSCNGRCANNSNRYCLEDSDCPGSTCQSVGSDGVINKCYGSGSDVVTGDPNKKDIVDLGGGDDFFSDSGTVGDIVQGGTGSDRITTTGGGSMINGGPFAASGPDISGDDVLKAGSNSVVIGGGGRDKLSAGGSSYVGTTSFGGFGAYPPVADDNVGSLLCASILSTVVAAGPRHQCVSCPAIGSFNCTVYYQYQNAVLGGRAAESSDLATCNGSDCTLLGTGGSVENGSKADCGCQ